MYGRSPLYHSCNTMFAAFTVACAVAPSLNSLIALRFLQGCAGSAPLAIGGGTITDLIPQERRGKYMGIYALGPTLGPIFGPVAGGFLTGAKGWRWLMWLLLMIVSYVAFPLVGLFLQWALAIMRLTIVNAIRREQSPSLVSSSCEKPTVSLSWHAKRVLSKSKLGIWLCVQHTITVSQRADFGGILLYVLQRC